MNELLEKSNKILENNLDELIKFSQKNIKHKISVIEGRNITRRQIAHEMDPREIAMMMGEMG